MDKALIEAARSYLGVRFRHQGRSRYGMDCVGLVICAFRDIGYTINDRVAYGRSPFNGELESEIFNLFEPVNDRKPGDIFMMSFVGMPVSHVAIYTGDTIIHSYANIGKVVEQPFRDGRPAKLVQVVRFKEWQAQAQ